MHTTTPAIDIRPHFLRVRPSVRCVHEKLGRGTRLIMNTPHVGMWVWLVDSWTWGCSCTYSIPNLSPYFFTSESSLHFLKIIKKKIYVLVCLLFDGLWPLEMIRVCHHQHQHSFLHLRSFVCFHFRHTPRSREESNSLKHCLSVWAWVTQGS